MNKQFVPYELAVKLKELGFDEKCFSFYWNTPSLKHHKYLESGIRGEVRFDKFNNENRVSAPLWQQAEDFLLKKYNLYGVIIPTITMHWTFKTMTVVEDVVEVPPYKHVDGNDYSSVEEARQACLEKLIRLVEQN